MNNSVIVSITPLPKITCHSCADTIARAVENRPQGGRSYYSVVLSVFSSTRIETHQWMQVQEYDQYSQSYADAKRLCVGMFDDHERYPYEKYLLEHYTQPAARALDFACGMGRMMNRMLKHFDHVDGVDLNARNHEYAFNTSRKTTGRVKDLIFSSHQA